MTTIRFIDPMDFLNVHIAGKSTEQHRMEAVQAQEFARTVVHFDDRTPQFTSHESATAKGLEPGVRKGPNRMVHSKEASELISHGGTLDGADSMHKIIKKRRPKVDSGQNYQYPAYSPHAEGQVSSVTTGLTY